jgi:predicted MarR family transcription regulator
MVSTPPGCALETTRVVAVLAAIVGFTHLLAGFDNPTLVRLVATLLDRPYTNRQATYDLRRLKRKGLITRIPGRHRYQVTPLGRRVAVLFTKAYARVLTPGLAALDPQLPEELSTRSELATAWRQLDRSLDHFIADGLAAA